MKPKDSIENLLNQMNAVIEHRGPDGEGIYSHTGTIEERDYSVGMGMRRLAVIDLTTGDQPVYSDDQNLAIVFNGEIYNYRELRQRLMDNGVTFNTQSDTEVVLKLYESEGTEALRQLDGMFAFSIHDSTRNVVIIARDFFGEKPLYYRHDETGIVWASELKSLLLVGDSQPVISKKGLNLFFRLGYIPAPFTIYEGIQKLESNHYMSLSLGHNVLDIKPIDQPKPAGATDIGFEDAKKTIREKVYESVASRSIADVPLGTFLSGGVDSSVIATCMAQLNEKQISTFSIAYENKKFDESHKAKLVADQIGSKHHEFVITEKDVRDSFTSVLGNFDEPFADSAALPTNFLSKKTREHVTVALTGDGGDEVFGGYNKYYIGKLNKLYTRFIPSAAHNLMISASDRLLTTQSDQRGLRFKLRKLIKAVDYDGGFFWNIISLANADSDVKALLLDEHYDANVFDHHHRTSAAPEASTLSEFREVDRLVSLEGAMLPKVDRTSMLQSLECRAPFLNKDLWRYTHSLPERYLMKGWDKKHILKEAFRDQFPKGFLDLKKQGFGTPIGDWLRSDLDEELSYFSDQDRLEKQGIFNPEYVRELLHLHLSGKQDNTFRVWAFFCFQVWYFTQFQPDLPS